MFIPAVIFTKMHHIENSPKVLFCLAQGELFQFNLSLFSPTEFAKKNKLLRHDPLDWQVNRDRPLCFFFEWENSAEKPLPETLFCEENASKEIYWESFPKSIGILSQGAQKNLLQLAVQYISYGMVDDSVIAADYDKEWVLKNLS